MANTRIDTSYAVVCHNIEQFKLTESHFKKMGAIPYAKYDPTACLCRISYGVISQGTYGLCLGQGLKIIDFNDWTYAPKLPSYAGVPNGIITICSQRDFDIFEGHMNQKYNVQPGAKFSISGIDNNFYTDHLVGSGRSPTISRVSDGMAKECYSTITFSDFCKRENIKLPSEKANLVGQYVLLKSFDKIISKYYDPLYGTQSTESVVIHGIKINRKYIDYHQYSPMRIVSADERRITGHIVYRLSDGVEILDEMIERSVDPWIPTRSGLNLRATPGSLVCAIDSGPVIRDWEQYVKSALDVVAKSKVDAMPPMPAMSDTRRIKFSKVL